MPPQSIQHKVTALLNASVQNSMIQAPENVSAGENMRFVVYARDIFDNIMPWSTSDITVRITCPNGSFTIHKVSKVSRNTG